MRNDLLFSSFLCSQFYVTHLSKLSYRTAHDSFFHSPIYVTHSFSLISVITNRSRRANTFFMFFTFCIILHSLCHVLHTFYVISVIHFCTLLCHSLLFMLLLHLFTSLRDTKCRGNPFFTFLAFCCSCGFPPARE
jgi:hypothetical protein